MKRYSAFLKAPSITGTSPSDCLVSYLGHALGRESAVCVFYSLSRLGKVSWWRKEKGYIKIQIKTKTYKKWHKGLWCEQYFCHHYPKLSSWYQEVQNPAPPSGRKDCFEPKHQANPKFSSGFQGPDHARVVTGFQILQFCKNLWKKKNKNWSIIYILGGWINFTITQRLFFKFLNTK